MLPSKLLHNAFKWLKWKCLIDIQKVSSRLKKNVFKTFYLNFKSKDLQPSTMCFQDLSVERLQNVFMTPSNYQRFGDVFNWSLKYLELQFRTFSQVLNSSPRARWGHHAHYDVTDIMILQWCCPHQSRMLFMFLSMASFIDKDYQTTFDCKAWACNYIHINVAHVIIYPCHKFNSGLLNNRTGTMDAITYPCSNLRYTIEDTLFTIYLCVILNSCFTVCIVDIGRMWKYYAFLRWFRNSCVKWGSRNATPRLETTSQIYEIIRSLRCALCNKRYPSEIHLKPKPRQISFAHNLLRQPIVLKFSTEHDSDTVVLCAKVHNDCTRETEIIDERDLVSFGVKMSFGWISYIARGTRYLSSLSRVFSRLYEPHTREVIECCE